MEKYTYLRGTNKECVDAFDVLQKEIDYFEPTKSTALFVPCSWGKPYSQSYIHYFINSALYRGDVLKLVDRWHVSNAGVIPARFELAGKEDDVGFFAYDWISKYQTTEEGEYHVKRTTERLRYWKEKFFSKYQRIVCYLREGSKGLEAVRNVFDDHIFFVEIIPIKANVIPMYRHDPDTVLINPNNLQNLVKCLNEFRFHTGKRSINKNII